MRYDFETVKRELLAVQTPEEFMSFQDKYPDLHLKDYDQEMSKRLSWLIRQAPGSCGTQAGVHEECFPRKK